MQMGVKFKTTNNLDFYRVSDYYVAKAKFDIKNDLIDILANIILKEPRKYRALNVFLRDIFTILNFFHFFWFK
jgi:hypothetical protein